MEHLPALEGGSPVRDEFLPFSTPSIGEEEITEVVDTLRSGWITTGPKVQRFEEEFARFTHADHAVAVSSCTAALHLSLLAVGCGLGDEVVVPDLTFPSTVNSVVHTGARPVLADIDPVTWNVTPDGLARCVTPNTRAVMPVHFGGLPCDLDGIYAMAAERGIRVIEDCAHAVGAEYRGKPIGSTPGPCAFSFYANKNITTVEGGMITTDDADVAEKASTWRLHGLDRDAWKRFDKGAYAVFRCVYPGFKYNLTDVAASLGLWQLRRLPEMLARREEIAAEYDGFVARHENLSRQPRPERAVGRHGLHLYAVTIDAASLRISRDQLVAAIRAENIGVVVHYESIHRQPYYTDLLGQNDGDLPVATRVGSSILSLPLSPDMTGSDASDTVEGMEKILEYYRR